MPDGDRDFVGSIPQIYDDLLVPLIFEGYAVALAKKVLACQPARILETAAGSGVVPRALAPHLPQTTQYVATDLHQAMLDHAISRMPPLSNVSWQTADAMALPYQDASFDVAICQFGVMFFPDRVASYREIARVLSSNGTWIFAVWDDVESNEFAQTVTNAAATVFPENPPTFLPRVAYGYHDTEAIRHELTEAGFSNVRIETVAHLSVAESARVPAVAYCQGTPLRNEIEDRNPELLAKTTEVATEHIVERFGAAEVSGKIRAHIISAVKA